MDGASPVNFLGPSGVNSRIAQIQSQLDALSPKPAVTPNPALPTGKLGGGNVSFANTLGGLMPMSPEMGQVSPLSGAIGGASGANKETYKAMATAAAERYGLDPQLFSALVGQESDWNPDAVSHAGAKGLCQLMDNTAASLGVNNPFDPEESLNGGAKYLRQMMDRFHGDTKKALAAYNAGPGFVASHNQADWYAETKGYVKTILSHSGSNS